MLPMVTADLPMTPMSPVTKWKHLSGLEFADPNYGTPAYVDILLGGKVFSKAVLHSRRFGPTGAPTAFKMCFGWVLNGDAKGKGQQSLTHVCCVALNNNDQRRYRTKIYCTMLMLMLLMSWIWHATWYHIPTVNMTLLQSSRRKELTCRVANRLLFRKESR